MLVNLLNPINTHLYILNLNTLIYLYEPGDLTKSNLVIHFPTILSRIPLAEANLVIHLPAILSRMPLAEANLVNTLDFIYIELDIIVIAFTRKTLNCISAKRREKSPTCSACLVTSSNRRSNLGRSSWITKKSFIMISLSQIL